MRMTRGKHILFVTHKYPPSTGGMQKQSFELIQNTRQIAPVEAIIFNNQYPIFLFVICSLPWALIKLIRNPKIEVVHANDTIMALFLTPLLLFKRIKLTATVHGLDIVFRFKPFQWWVQKLFSKFDLLVAVSNETRQECIKRGIPQEKVVFIPNAITPPANEEKDTDFISTFEKKVSHSFEGKKIILSVGRPIQRKGFSWFVEKVIPNLETNCIYVIVGASLKRRYFFKFFRTILPKTIFNLWCQMNGISTDSLVLEKLSKNIRYKNSFILSGKLTDQELAQIYLHADLFVMPNRRVESDFEGFGLVALEAGVRGLPCVASTVDGIPSAIKNDVNGYLLPELDDKVWSQKIDSLLNSHDLKEIGLKFQKNILKKNYSWKKMASTYMNEFNKLF